MCKLTKQNMADLNKILPIPSSVNVEENMQGITVSYRWYKPMVWLIIFFAIFWNGFMVVWMLAPTPWFFKAFGAIHVGVGIGLVWYITCLFVNKTEIIITKYEFRVEHKPLPFFNEKNCKFDKQEVKQIYVKENISRGKNNATTISYELYKLDSNAKSTKVMGGIDNSELAIFIKRKVELFFGISPQAIEGEYL